MCLNVPFGPSLWACPSLGPGLPPHQGPTCFLHPHRGLSVGLLDDRLISLLPQGKRGCWGGAVLSPRECSANLSQALPGGREISEWGFSRHPQITARGAR